MARERIVSSTEQSADAEQATGALRPGRIDEYVGQRDLIERIRIAIEAAKGRGEPMEHVLLHGPPGLGKTTLAHVIAAEMGTRAYVTSGPALTKAAVARALGIEVSFCGTRGHGVSPSLRWDA